MSALVIPAVGSLTVQTIHDACAFVMLEDFQLSLQLSEADFLSIFALIYLDFFEKTGMVHTVYTQMGSFAISQYTVPDEITRPVLVFYDGRLISRESQGSLDNGRGSWQDQIGEPQAWHEDGLPPKTIEIASAPQFQGVNMVPAFGDLFAGSGEVSIVGPVRPTAVTFTLGTVLDLIPNSFAHYLTYGVLAKIFGQDGETKDEARMRYCDARCQEGVALAQMIAGDDMEEYEAQ